MHLCQTYFYIFIEVNSIKISNFKCTSAKLRVYIYIEVYSVNVNNFKCTSVKLSFYLFIEFHSVKMKNFCMQQVSAFFIVSGCLKWKTALLEEKQTLKNMCL